MKSTSHSHGLFPLTGSSSEEIAESIKNGIDTGRLRAGDSLPSVRLAATMLDVNRNTVALAYQRLAMTGLVSTSRRGTTVSSGAAAGVIPEPEIPEGVIDLSYGNPDPTLLPDLDRAFQAAAARPPRLYGGEEDVDDLVELVREGGERDELDAQNVLITSGAFDAIERILLAHAGPGDAVAVEDPCFTKIIHLVQQLGLRPIAMAMDDEGVLPGSLKRALEQSARCVIVTPTAQNPTGATLSDSRASELREVLARHRSTLLIEDDHYRQLTTKPAHSLAAGQPTDRWAVVRSFAKCFGPDLRLAGVIADASTAVRVRRRRAVGAQWVSHIIQRAAVELHRAPENSGNSSEAGRIYTLRRQRLLEELAARGVQATGSEGLHVWLPTPHDERVARFLLARGWAVRTGEMFRVRHANGIRITSGVLDTELAPRLADTVAEAMGRPVEPTDGS